MTSKRSEQFGVLSLTPNQHKTLLALTARADTLHKGSVDGLMNRGLARRVGPFVMLTPLGREYLNAGKSPLHRRQG